MTTTLTQLQSAVVAALKALPGVVQCELYGGQFAGEPGSRVAIHAPAILIELTDGRPSAEPGTGELDLACRLSAYVLARYAGDREAREAGAIDLAEAVALTVHRNAWGLIGVGEARIERLAGATNLAADRAGFSLWGVSWTQDIRLGASTLAGGYGPATDVRIGVSPNIGPGNESAYTQL